MRTTSSPSRLGSRAFGALFCFLALAGPARGDRAPAPIDHPDPAVDFLDAADLEAVEDGYCVDGKRTLFSPLLPPADGTGPAMLVSVAPDGGGGVVYKRGLVRFDIRGNIPAEATVHSATLRLYQSNTVFDSPLATPRCHVGRILEAWNETSLTGCPGYAPVSEVEPGSSPGWKEFEVTEVVREWVDGVHPNHGFSLSSSLLPFTFLTRESAKDPQLRIVYSRLPDPPPPERFRRGDADGNRELNLVDAIRVLNHLFGSSQDLSCLDAADANDSGLVDITDPIYLLAFLFQGGTRPPAPHPGCGVDPTRDRLSCRSYDACPRPIDPDDIARHLDL